MSDTAYQALPLLDEPALNDLKDMLGEALREISDSFLEGLDAEVAAIEAALATGGMPLKAAAHSLKGSAGNLGARRLAGLSSAIEKAAMDGRLADCQVLVPGLKAVALETRQAIDGYMAKP
jgi:HPt (histidine-containing phosphotransfer) domain-containing protein